MAKQTKKKRRPRRPRGRWVLQATALLVLLVLIMGVVGFIYLSAEMEKRFSGRLWSVPATVLSDSVVIYPGQDLTISAVEDMLTARGYRPAVGGRLRPGEYKRSRRALRIFFRAFAYPGKDLPAREVGIRFQGGRIQEIRTGSRPVPYLEVEPVVLARLFGKERESRHLISIKTTPENLIHAVIAIEDHRFFQHRGIDWRGILRALWVDLRAGRVVQGGSTLTQQLVKNYFLRPERTLKRKLLEAAMALVLEARYSKEQILEMYLNEIYMGQQGSVAIHGMGQAAFTYFGRNVEDLTLAEAAALAGMIKAPNRYSPTRHPDACRERRNVVLARMRELGLIDAAAYESALSQPLRTVSRALSGKTLGYYVDYVNRQLEELYSEETLSSEGLVIYTSYRPEIALEAERAVREGLAALEKKRPALSASDPAKALQAALVVVQPKTGALVALVGGRDFALSPYNRAVRAHRQPGSAFKPFVYLTALDQVTPVSWIEDMPTAYRVDGKAWVPRNYDGRYRGAVMVREALAHSLNAATVHLAVQVGLSKIVETARRLGLQSPLKPYPSLALGAFEVTPLELAGAYAALANEGQRPHLVTIKKVVTPQGAVLERRHMSLKTVTTPAKAFLITRMLQRVVREGTARRLASYGVDFPCAGKTGTTSDYRDAWFVGYTSDLLALVWVGFDDNRPTRLTGSSGALPLWARFMTRIRPWLHPQDFPVPPGVVERTICLDSGDLAVQGCPRKEREYFLAERVPQKPCTLHWR
ncbi:penicillin-binding protein 1B [Desulfacinum hydrothermale DSM 13146]|uniref:Penicillin-binding protein 1B n=1 Tax=Desulfacinum hydrothermale DSM 13146 TaxID=1121390 RepID=A0A1W1XBP9_9BACT|nr:PBP1A family penicillin-binding protein [Desulfacinum hydrothermale]SMC21312.1 penicillin-binding protein 1B [Desulfacinum hydrothermale DSM 13146]